MAGWHSAADGCIRFVKDIGLWAFSRGAPTCLWRTSWCRERCYNLKFYAVNPLLPERDREDEQFWQRTSDFEFAWIVMELGVRRFRFSTRGEIWTDAADVQKVASIMLHAPSVLFWIPTRAWRVVEMQHSIEELVLPLPNARVLASLDPSVPEFVEDALKQLGWSTVFAGENDPDQLRLSDAMCVDARTQGKFRCPKTWQSTAPGMNHVSGLCAECQDGCFSAHRVDVHLRQHK